jgi:solute carrier family 35, member F5
MIYCFLCRFARQCFDYWAKAILLTTTTVATAGLTIQVPIASIIDTLTSHAPHLLNYIGAAAVLVGFAGINIPAETPQADQQEQETPIVSMVDDPLCSKFSFNPKEALIPAIFLQEGHKDKKDVVTACLS